MDSIKSVSVRFTGKEYALLEAVVSNYRRQVGVACSRHSVIKMIMHHGLNAFIDNQMRERRFQESVRADFQSDRPV